MCTLTFKITQAQWQTCLWTEKWCQKIIALAYEITCIKNKMPLKSTSKQTDKTLSEIINRQVLNRSFPRKLFSNVLGKQIRCWVKLSSDWILIRSFLGKHLANVLQVTQGHNFERRKFSVSKMIMYSEILRFNSVTEGSSWCDQCDQSNDDALLMNDEQYLKH